MNGPLSRSQIVQQRYEILGYIGAGGMQHVYLAHDSTLGRNIALKTPKDSAAEKRFHRSAIVAAKVNHPNVAKTLDYFEDEGRQFLVEEFIDGEDLDQTLVRRIAYVDPYLAAKIFHHLAKAVAAAHHAGVIHRDLKPTNVMATGGFDLTNLKVTDFGIAKMAEEELIEAAEGGTATLSTNATAVGALPYMSPEAIDTPRAVGKPTDIWSIGAMMYQLLTGKLPFGSGLRAVRNIMDGAVPAFPSFMTANPQFSSLAGELTALILQCLQKDPAARPDADALVRRFSEICYPLERRVMGTVRTIRHNAWGFIDIGTGSDVFFHLSSVYGTRPTQDQQVILAQYRGGGASRAHPVLVVTLP
ncbi:serine/threonine-protein kinase [Caballeronia sp. KNU42]